MNSRFQNPWTNPVGELLYPVLAFALRFVPKVYDSPSPAAGEEPEVGSKSFRYCKTCDTETLFQKLWWPVEQEFTIECTECDEVWND